jgi:hypothetical protein
LDWMSTRVAGGLAFVGAGPRIHLKARAPPWSLQAPCAHSHPCRNFKGPRREQVLLEALGPLSSSADGLLDGGCPESKTIDPQRDTTNKLSPFMPTGRARTTGSIGLGPKQKGDSDVGLSVAAIKRRLEQPAQFFKKALMDKGSRRTSRTCPS